MNNSNEEILKSLREKHGQEIACMSDLERPTCEFMKRYFVTVLSELGIDMQDLSQPKDLPSASNAELLKDIFPYVRLYQAVRDVHPLPKYLKQFSLMSLLEPKKEDIYYVAVMDNFFDFYHHCSSTSLEPRLQELGSILEKYEALMLVDADLQQQLSNIDAARSRRIIEQTKYEEELMGLSEREKVLKKQLEQLEAEAADVVQEKQQLQREVAEEQRKTEELEERMETQKQYDSVAESLCRLKIAMQEQEKDLEEKSDLRHNKSSRRRFLEMTVAMEEQANVEVNELMALASENEKRKAVIQQLQLKKESALREEEKCKLKCMESREKVSNVQEDIVVIEKETISINEKIKERDREIQELNLQLKKSNEKLTFIQESDAGVRQVIEALKRKLEILDQNFEKTVQTFYGKVDTYKQRLLDKLKSFEKSPHDE